MGFIQKTGTERNDDNERNDDTDDDDEREAKLANLVIAGS